MAVFSAAFFATCTQEKYSTDPADSDVAQEEIPALKMEEIADIPHGTSLIGRTMCITINAPEGTEQYTVQMERDEKQELLLFVNGRPYRNLDTICLGFTNVAASTMIQRVLMDDGSLAFHSDLVTGVIDLPQMEQALRTLAIHSKENSLMPVEIVFRVKVENINALFEQSARMLFVKNADESYNVPFHFDPIAKNVEKPSNITSVSQKHTVDLSSRKQ